MNMKRTMIVLLVLFEVCIESSFACGPEWTYVGHPPYESMCVEVGNESDQSLLCGVWRTPDDPNGGGIYRQTENGTAWELAGLQGLRVYSLRRFFNLPSQIFAATEQCLYRSLNNGAFWDSVTTAGATDWWVQRDLVVSPFDSAEWAIHSDDTWGMHRILVSENSGRECRLLAYIVGLRSIAYSHHFAHRLYGQSEMYLFTLSTQDTAIDTVLQSPSVYFRRMDMHPTQPWIYILSADSIQRYDEITGDVLAVALPDLHRGVNLRVAPDHHLLIGTETGLYVVSEDLQTWQLQTASALQGYVEVLHASTSRWVCMSNGDLYCMDPGLSVPPTEPARANQPITIISPNPVSNLLTLNLPYAAQVDLFNLLGQRVTSFVTTSGQPRITYNISHLGNGVYFYVIAPLGQKGMAPLSGKIAVIK
jgi:hypothetical protein